MKLSTALILIAVIVLTTTTTLAAFIHIKKPKGPVHPNSYIVVLKSGTNMEAHIKGITQVSTRNPGSEFSVTYQYEHKFLNGYSAHATGASLTRILSRFEVAYVESDVIISIDHDLHEVNERDVAEHDNVSVKMEECDKAPIEALIYAVDTGIKINHADLEGRASWGTVVGGGSTEDLIGHGTATAAIAVGKLYGIATHARIIAVKVSSDDNGKTSLDYILQGLHFIFGQFLFNNHLHPSVTLMCISLPPSSAIADAVKEMIATGMHVVVSAGNNKMDASNSIPQSVDGVNTIGAINGKTNMIASFSNYGSVIIAFAPGVNIRTAGIRSNTESVRKSGTSMAAAFVAGVFGEVLGQAAAEIRPADLTRGLKIHGDEVVEGQPTGTTKLRAPLPW
ncbi:peptidase S8/S53 domain-containing protein [Cantharellus anzutake]|uniref:peptidase S8/S53 domain-containing protein n=1 Tax=Cantharellus anzutake TaxID=1750568 RepID=UPI0019087A17|nr:peptidase S8/S53 domain-containing protein [Cantharellus anzutake]KAF8321432.1 peptidase S8/S53 domain-containing protein [Cantharellus anzutake]